MFKHYFNQMVPKSMGQSFHVIFWLEKWSPADGAFKICHQVLQFGLRCKVRWIQNCFCKIVTQFNNNQSAVASMVEGLNPRQISHFSSNRTYRWDSNLQCFDLGSLHYPNCWCTTLLHTNDYIMNSSTDIEKYSRKY